MQNFQKWTWSSDHRSSTAAVFRKKSAAEQFAKSRTAPQGLDLYGLKAHLGYSTNLKEKKFEFYGCIYE